MQTKLLRIGNSIGLKIPDSELKHLDVKAGDVVEIEIKRIIRHLRASWDDADQWRGADTEPLLLDSLPAPDFENERDKDRQW